MRSGLICLTHGGLILDCYVGPEQGLRVGTPGERRHFSRCWTFYFRWLVDFDLQPRLLSSLEGIGHHLAESISTPETFLSQSYLTLFSESVIRTAQTY